jgi:hypothetical protein
MMIERREVIVYLFSDPEDARAAMDELRTAGFTGDDISFLSPGNAHAATPNGDKRDTGDKRDEGARVREGAITGAVAGGLFGGLAGWLIALGTVAVPGVGPVLAAGALAAAIGGAAVGAGLGGIAGALISMGVPESEAKQYEQEVRNGRTLVAVRGKERNDEADRILHRHSGFDLQHREGAPASRG